MQLLVNIRLILREEFLKETNYHHYCLSLHWFHCQQYWATQATAIKYQKCLPSYHTSFTIWSWWKNTICNRITSQLCPYLQSRYCKGVWTGQIWHTHHQTVKNTGIKMPYALRMPYVKSIMSLDKDYYYNIWASFKLTTLSTLKSRRKLAVNTS